MFTVHDSATAIVLCTLTMLGWGSWVNTMKVAAKRAWPLELYYWDYVVGMLVTSLLVALTFGSLGSDGVNALSSLTSSSSNSLKMALLGGALFNCANLLVVLATELAGIAIAFPVAAGPALILSTALSYKQAPIGRIVPLCLGIGLILIAMTASAIASQKLHASESIKRKDSALGVILAVLSAGAMGFFYPCLARSIEPAPTQGSMIREGLTPYAACVIFAAGVFVSNLLVNTILLYARGKRYRNFVAVPLRRHGLGLAGGAIWICAISANLVACRVAGPAVSYALGQGATLVAAIWGVFIWKEFRGASRFVKAMLAVMFVSYGGGLAMVGMAAL